MHPHAREQFCGGVHEYMLYVIMNSVYICMCMAHVWITYRWVQTTES